MFDVFYKNHPPDRFIFEKHASTLEEAATNSRTEFFWWIVGKIDPLSVDWDWKPVPWEKTHIHIWPSQWNRNSGVLLAHKDHAGLKNYHFRQEFIVRRLPDFDGWDIPDGIDVSNFDFSWHPDFIEGDFEYRFPTQWRQHGGPIYKGTAGIKFCNEMQVLTLPDLSKWYIPDDIDISNFDFSWHPDPFDPPYEYRFPTQWQREGGPVYKGTAGIKHCNDMQVNALANLYAWHIPDNIDITNFDFSWHPDPFDPPYEYRFPTQWQREGGPVYKGTAGIKYCNEIQATALPIMDAWYIPDNIDITNFDFSWHPSPFEPPYEYHFPTQWQREGGPVYKGTAGIKHCNDMQVTALPNMDAWYIPDNIDITNFDFSWHPSPFEPPYEYRFPTQWQREGGPVYKGTAGIKYCKVMQVTALPNMDAWHIPDNIDITNFDFSWHPSPFEPPYEYRFPTQWQRHGGPIYKGTAGVKFCSDMRVTALPNMDAWYVPDNIDVSEFDFSWHPDPFEPPYEYRFPTQWQREGGPVYKGTAGIKYCTNQKVISGSSQIFYLDFFNTHSQEQFVALQEKHPTIKNIRYIKTHLNAFNRIMQLATTEYVWIISSICDYSDFDFTWHPDSSQKEMLHCFATDDLKRGDTFYVNVQSFKNQIESLEELDWFKTINYVSDQTVRRFPYPVVLYDTDDLVQEIKNHDFKHPYTIFSNQKDSLNSVIVDCCVWAEKDRTIHSLTLSNASCLVPKEIKEHIKQQVYDYPYINRSKEFMIKDNDLDIIYISNGEPDEQKWYDHTMKVSNRTVKWIKGVDGRANAYKAAANASETPWFLTVFAKLEVDKEFPWSWQPDYFQEPKHYIFNSKNPINGLEYGHMGMIAYNKKLVLETEEHGLDFTLSKPHEVVPILSGVARYNQNAWMTWRTAFREVIKLKHFSNLKPNVDTDYRLKKWLTVANGDFAEWSILGSKDAVEYYNDVNGDYNQLMFSFEWHWLKQHFDTKYKI
jgi:hypothetical protein